MDQISCDVARLKRYTPVVGDIVIGMITRKYHDAVKVDINSWLEGLLPISAFQGATKQHFPALKSGTCVLAGVRVVRLDGMAELSCISVGDTKSWSSGESYLGVLKQPGLFRSFSREFCDALIKEDCPILPLLCEKSKCEIVVGRNNRIHVTALKRAESIMIIDALRECSLVTHSWVDMLDKAINLRDSLAAAAVDLAT